LSRYESFLLYLILQPLTTSLVLPTVYSIRLVLILSSLRFHYSAAFGDVTTTITRNRLIKQNCKPSHNHKPAEGKQEAIALDAKNIIRRKNLRRRVVHVDPGSLGREGFV